MSIKSKCNICHNCKSDCGCKDDVLITQSNCEVSCYNPEKCSEVFSANCIIWDRDTLVDLGITKGMNVGDILERIIGVILNPNCNTPGEPCLAVVGFQSLSVAQTTATVYWSAEPSANQYQVQYKLATSPSFIGNPVTTNTFDSIGPLLPNTQYHIRIKTQCDNSISCYSDTILIKTKP